MEDMVLYIIKLIKKNSDFYVFVCEFMEEKIA